LREHECSSNPRRIGNGRKEKREHIKAVFGKERNPRPDRCERGAIRRRRRRRKKKGRIA